MISASFLSSTIEQEKIKKLEKILSSSSQRKNLYEYEVYDFLSILGIHTREYVFIPTNTNVSVIKSLLPANIDLFVAKVVVENLIHKTEVKGVVLDVTPDKAKDVYSEFSSRFPADSFKGVMFAKQLPLSGGLGEEILLSLFQDKDFGPMVAFGFGGVLVEELKENFRPNKSTLFLPATLNLEENISVIESHPVVRIVTGVARGCKKKVEIDELVRSLKLLQWVSIYFSTYNPNSQYLIEELEVNPATAYNGKLVALDGVLSCKSITPFSLSSYLPLSRLPKPLYKIESLLHPQSVIVAGASGKQRTSPGNIIVRKILHSGLIPAEHIYILHPAESHIEGLICYRTLTDVLASPGRKGTPVDLLVVAVRANNAGPLLEDAFAQHAVEAVLIVTAGFAETAGGASMQHRIEDSLKVITAAATTTTNTTPVSVPTSCINNNRRPVICGPNTLGYTSTGGIDTLFTPDYKSSSTMYSVHHHHHRDPNAAASSSSLSSSSSSSSPSPLFSSSSPPSPSPPSLPSNVCLISQSGAQLITRASDTAGRVSFAMAVSVGNQLDLSVTDVVEYVVQRKKEEIMKKKKKKKESVAAATSSSSTVAAATTSEKEEEKERNNKEKEKKERVDALYASIQVLALYIEGFNEGDGLRLCWAIEEAAEIGCDGGGEGKAEREGNGKRGGEEVGKGEEEGSEDGMMVVVYKAGRTKQGKDAAKGHTASMAGDYDMTSFLLGLHGAVVCDTFEEFEDAVMLCSYMPAFMRLRGTRRRTDGGKGKEEEKEKEKEGGKREERKKEISVGMITNAGFEKCALADHLFSNVSHTALTLPTYTAHTAAEISSFFKKCNLTEVIDVSPILDITPMMTEIQYVGLADVILREVDVAILATVPESVNFRVLPKYEPLTTTTTSSSSSSSSLSFSHTEDVHAPNGFVDLLANLRTAHPHTPFAVSMESGYLYDEVVQLLLARGIPCFRRADAAARVVRLVVRAMRGEVG